MQYRFLDEVNITKQKENSAYSSKWWFYGTKTELENWLPSPGDNADFSFLDSENLTLGEKWAPTGYIIRDVKAVAIDRFEWQVEISSENPYFYGNFKYPRDKTNLGSKNETDVEKGAFTITEEMCGYKWNPAISDYEDLSLTMNPPWSPATDCPFTARPGKANINQTIPCAIITETIYLANTPDNHITDFINFKGVQTIKNQSGRVIESRMTQVNDNTGAIYTQWRRAIMIAPAGFAWNSNWKGIS